MLDVGDIVGVAGRCFARRGEITINMDSFELLTASFIMPEKYHDCKIKSAL